MSSATIQEIRQRCEAALASPVFPGKVQFFIRGKWAARKRFGAGGPFGESIAEQEDGVLCVFNAQEILDYLRDVEPFLSARPDTATHFNDSVDSRKGSDMSAQTQTLSRDAFPNINNTQTFVIVPAGLESVPPEGLLSSILTGHAVAWTTKHVFVKDSLNQQRQYSRETALEANKHMMLLPVSEVLLLDLRDAAQLNTARTAIGTDRLIDLKQKLIEEMRKLEQRTSDAAAASALATSKGDR